MSSTIVKIVHKTNDLLKNHAIPTINTGDLTQNLDRANHPWKYNIRDLIRMLEGEIDIPHLLDGEKEGVSCYFSNCAYCLDALKLRNKYIESLSKEL